MSKEKTAAADPTAQPEPAEQPEMVKVVLTSTLSGDGVSREPGEVVEFDKDEAARVIGFGGARPYVEGEDQ